MRDYSDDFFAGTPVRGLPEGSTWNDLRKVALYQRIIIICLGCLLLLYGFLVFLIVNTTPDMFDVVLLVCVPPILLVGLTAMVATFLLSAKIYHPVLAVILSVMILVGCFGLIVLMVINQRATTILNKNGIKVGFFGASQSQFKSGID